MFDLLQTILQSPHFKPTIVIAICSSLSCVIAGVLCFGDALQMFLLVALGKKIFPSLVDFSAIVSPSSSTTSGRQNPVADPSKTSDVSLLAGQSGTIITDDESIEAAEFQFLVLLIAARGLFSNGTMLKLAWPEARWDILKFCVPTICVGTIIGSYILDTFGEAEILHPILGTVLGGAGVICFISMMLRKREQAELEKQKQMIQKEGNIINQQQRPSFEEMNNNTKTNDENDSSSSFPPVLKNVKESEMFLVDKDNTQIEIADENAENNREEAEPIALLHRRSSQHQNQNSSASPSLSASSRHLDSKNLSGVIPSPSVNASRNRITMNKTPASTTSSTNLNSKQGPQFPDVTSIASQNQNIFAESLTSQTLRPRQSTNQYYHYYDSRLSIRNNNEQQQEGEDDDITSDGRISISTLNQHSNPSELLTAIQNNNNNNNSNTPGFGSTSSPILNPVTGSPKLTQKKSKQLNENENETPLSMLPTLPPPIAEQPQRSLDHQPINMNNNIINTATTTNLQPTNQQQQAIADLDEILMMTPTTNNTFYNNNQQRQESQKLDSVTTSVLFDALPTPASLPPPSYTANSNNGGFFTFPTSPKIEDLTNTSTKNQSAPQSTLVSPKNANSNNKIIADQVTSTIIEELTKNNHGDVEMKEVVNKNDQQEEKSFVIGIDQQQQNENQEEEQQQPNQKEPFSPSTPNTTGMTSLTQDEIETQRKLNDPVYMKRAKRWFVLGALLSGVFGGLCAVGALGLVTVVCALQLPKTLSRGVLPLCWVALGATRMLYSAVTGNLVLMSSVPETIAMIVFGMIGTMIGNRIGSFFNNQQYLMCVVVMMIVGGLNLGSVDVTICCGVLLVGAIWIGRTFFVGVGKS